MLKIRQSALNSYEKCPFLCYKDWGAWGVYSPREDNEDVSTNKYALCGIAFHEVMETWGKRKIADECLPDNMELYHLHNKLEAEINAIDMKYFEDEDDREKFRQSLHEQLDWVFENWLINKPLMVEHTFDVSNVFEDFPDVTGTVDRIDGNLQTQDVELFDYKTGKLSTKKNLKDNIQAGLYSRAFQKEFGFLPKSFTFIYTKHKRTQEIMITKDFLDASEERIRRIVDNIKNNKFNPPRKMNRFFCNNFCAYKKECPKHVSPKGWEGVG